MCPSLLHETNLLTIRFGDTVSKPNLIRAAIAHASAHSLRLYCVEETSADPALGGLFPVAVQSAA
jgi:hypothetical protein